MSQHRWYLWLRWSFVLSLMGVVLGCWWLIVPATKSRREVIALAITSYLAVWGCYFWASQGTRPAKAARFIMVTVSLAVAVLIFEFLAYFHVLDFRLSFGVSGQPIYHPLNELDSELLHIHRPHLRYRGVTGGNGLVPSGEEKEPGATFELRFDHQGFRNPRDYSRAEIVLIGDSFVEGANVQQEDLISTRLTQLTQRTVCNLGQSWYGPQQELAVLRRFGIPLKPEIVIWSFFEGNDLYDAWRYVDLKEQLDEIREQRDSYVSRSLLGNILDLAIDQLHYDATRPRDQYGIVTSGDGTTTRLWFGYDPRPLGELEKNGLAVFRRTIKQAWELCRAGDIDLAVVFIPTKFRVYQDVCEFPPGSAIADWRCAALPDEIRRIVVDTSGTIGFVDLTPVFRQSAAEGNILYFRGDSHFSAAGHELAAAEITRQLDLIDDPTLGSVSKLSIADKRQARASTE